VNRTYRRSGTLWEGRFRSCLAESEHYLFACCRYIELNPVRAGIVSHLRQHRWSSYRVNAEGKASDLIVPHEVYRERGPGILSKAVQFASPRWRWRSKNLVVRPLFLPPCFSLAI